MSKKKENLLEALREEVRRSCIRVTGFARILKYVYDGGASLEDFDPDFDFGLPKIPKNRSLITFAQEYRKANDERLERIIGLIKTLENMR